MAFPYKRATLLGLGKSNLAVARYLKREGISLTLCDKNPDCKIPNDVRDGAILRLGEDYLDLSGSECIFVSPVIRHDLAEIERARKNGAKITSEAELFFSLCPSRVVGVTGSDGKTTTATMAYEIIRRSHPAALCGNIGTPMLEVLDTLSDRSVCITELSSFQLMNISPKVASAAITNITENHLNWHKNMDEYVSAKMNIYKSADRRVANADDCALFGVDADVYFSTEQDITALRSRFPDKEYALVENGEAVLYAKGERRQLFSLSDMSVFGEHNIKNALTAAALCAPISSDADISEAIKSFSGVAHRAEKIGEHNGISFIESSIDSTPSRTAATLSSLGYGCVVICGGADKRLSYTPLCEALLRYARAVVFTGECGADMHSALSAYPEGEGIEQYCEWNFDRAVALAISVARRGERVVLSPAATSFDRFKNYIERAERFAKIIKEYIKTV